MFLTHSCPIRALLPLTRDSHLILNEDKKHLDISLFFLLFCWCCILSATLGSPAGLAIQYCLFPHLTFPESTETWGVTKAPHTSLWFGFVNNYSALSAICIIQEVFLNRVFFQPPVCDSSLLLDNDMGFTYNTCLQTDKLSL